MLRFLALGALLLAVMLPLGGVRAESPAQIRPEYDLSALMKGMRLDEVLGLVAQEGITAAREFSLEVEDARFDLEGQLQQLYSLGPLQHRFRIELEAALNDQPAVILAAVQFYDSAQGKALVTGEVLARQELISFDATEAAEVAVEKLSEQRSPRLVLLQNLIAAGDMVEGNVTINLNGSRAFNEGFNQALPPSLRRKEVDILAEVAAGEAGARHAAQLWLMAFLHRAYRDLSDEDVKALEAFYLSAEGKALSQAIFGAFERTFDPVLRAQGQMMAHLLLGRVI